MPHSIQLALGALVSAALIAGCGGSSTPSAVTVGAATTTGSSTATTRAATNTGSRSPAPSPGTPNALAFARCMRANGVPNFPDPSPGGGFVFSTNGINPAAPAVQAAQKRCQRFAPQPPGSGGSSESPQVKAQALAQLRGVAVCMRRHGISDFPDPTPTRPANLSLGVYSEITDYMGVFLLFPATIDMQSPAWQQAASACGSLAESFGHPHH